MTQKTALRFLYVFLPLEGLGRVGVVQNPRQKVHEYWTRALRITNKYVHAPSPFYLPRYYSSSFCIPQINRKSSIQNVMAQKNGPRTPV
jgi:hypothetical protein